MPSDRKQINMRVDGETEELLRGLVASCSAAIGLALSQSDVVRLALQELAKKYPPAAPEAKQPPAAAARTRRRGK